jgi:hypothetical protein
MKVAECYPVTLCLAALVVSVVTTSAFAASHHASTAHHRAAAYSSFASAPDAGFATAEDQVSPARAKAIRECNDEVRPYAYTTWQTTQIIRYGVCMTEHGQIQ